MKRTDRKGMDKPKKQKPKPEHVSSPKKRMSENDSLEHEKMARKSADDSSGKKPKKMKKTPKWQPNY